MRNVEKIIDTTDIDIQRGTVGVGSNDFSDVYYDGLSV